jgi:hypothetical protein
VPYKSKAEERWAHTSTGEQALGGPEKVKEWDQASKGEMLPERAPIRNRSGSHKSPSTQRDRYRPRRAG